MRRTPSEGSEAISLHFEDAPSPTGANALCQRRLDSRRSPMKFATRYIPRLMHALERLGYAVIRSEVFMSDRARRTHAPYDHNPAAQSSTARFIDDRTLHAILSEVAQRRAISVESLSEML